jgi:hypothetical protein
LQATLRWRYGAAVQTVSCKPLLTPSLGPYTTKACQTQMRVIPAASGISGTATCSWLSRALRYSRSANRAFTSGEVHDSSRYDRLAASDWITMTHSWKIIGGASLVVAYVISAYQILRSLIRPSLGETFRWLLPRAFFCLLAFCVFMYWIVEGEWLKYKDDLRNHSVQNTSSPRR